MTQTHDSCACCGKPTQSPETHHHNENRGDNHPDNLQTRDRRCHMNHHQNQEAVDHHTQRRYGPPSTGSPGPRR